MTTKSNLSWFPFILIEPLCGCAGGAACGRSIEDEGTTLPADQIPAMSISRPAPVRAACYEPNPMDPIDVELSWHLMSTHHPAVSKLMLCRLESGEYTIEGRHVSIHWGTFGPGACRATQLLVSELQVNGDWDSLETPLPVYLAQALDVLLELDGQCSGSPAVARVPIDDRLSFFSMPSKLAPEIYAESERISCMERACEEARLREEAVEAYERGKNGKGVSELQQAVSNSLNAEYKVRQMVHKEVKMGRCSPSSPKKVCQESR